MANLTADGSTSPTLTFDPTGGKDWEFTGSDTSLSLRHQDGSGGWTPWMNTSGTNTIFLGDGSTLSVDVGAVPAIGWPGGGRVKFADDHVSVAEPLEAHDGVETDGSLNNTGPVKEVRLYGVLGSTSPLSIDLGVSNKVLSAFVMLEDPTTSGRFGSIPVDSPYGGLGQDNYCAVVRNTGSNDIVVIHFDTGTFAATDTYKVFVHLQV